MNAQEFAQEFLDLAKNLPLTKGEDEINPPRIGILTIRELREILCEINVIEGNITIGEFEGILSEITEQDKEMSMPEFKELMFNI